jgi:phosphinothricin acetyltransferase
VAIFEFRVVGWVSLSRWSDRCAYRETGEVSAYVHPAFRGQGVGGQLIAAILTEAQRLGFHTLLARIVEGNEASLRLCTAVGFEPVGVMREVGFKFGCRLNVHLLQKLFT